MKNRSGRNKGCARSIRRLFHKIKISKSRTMTAVIAFTAVVVGAVPFTVSYVVADAQAGADGICNIGLVSAQVAPVAVSAEIDAAKESIIKESATEEETTTEKETAIVEETAVYEEIYEEPVTEETQTEPVTEETQTEPVTEETQTEPVTEETQTESVQKETEETTAEEQSGQENSGFYTELLYTGSQFKYYGEIYWNNYRWTWYSEKVLPGGGLSIPGRWVDDSGYICDENNYICLASSDLAKGTVVPTPFGKDGCVYDCGCSSGTLDVYTSW